MSIHFPQIFATVFMAIISNQVHAQAKSKYFVMSCNDGDTCKMQDTAGKIIKVRLVGIDAPETHGSKKKHREHQPFSLEAKDFINKRIAQKNVELVTYNNDVYGRTLGDIILDGKSVNMEIVQAGLAECYRGKPPKDYDTNACVQNETDAKKNKRGIWSLENYESPKAFRKK